MNCPSCGAELEESAVDLDEGTVRCPQCGHVSKLVLGAGVPVVPRVEKPAGTRVVVDRSRSGQIALYIPGRGGLSFLFFAAFWLTITGILTALAVSSGEGFPILFMVPFWLVGLGMLLIGLFMRFGVTGVYVDRQRFIVSKTLFGKGWTRRGATDEISTIQLSEAYRSNEVPVMAVSIAAGASTYSVGSFLKDDEKRWLVSELRAFMAEIGRRV
jgi:DNA-directed RNA polymerase subunit RPC12/RpoP